MADTRQHLDDIKSFDVSLSFAGEDRLFVSEVAKELAHNGLLVFYDHYFKSDLLGRDLVTTLRVIYGERSRFCAAFVSASYARKRWSQQVERVAILDRALRDELRSYGGEATVLRSGLLEPFRQPDLQRQAVAGRLRRH